MLACSKCNSVWKRNQFPVQGPRATKTKHLKSELPHLLNPFETDPTDHLEYEDILGTIFSRTIEGQSTIDVCGLDRETLGKQRLIKAQKLDRRFCEYEEALVLCNQVAVRNALRSILDECRNESAHAGMARFLTKRRTLLSFEDLLSLEQAGAL